MRGRPLLTFCGVAVALVGCNNMANQPKRLPFELPFGATAENWPAVPPQGIVARDDPVGPPSPPPVKLALLQRGQERFDIYCAPCHGQTGEGDGMIVRRGFPHPPSYYEARLREAPVQHFYDVITNGYGAMFPYASRVAPADRWAIAAYIRALQASGDGRLSDVPQDRRQDLQ